MNVGTFPYVGIQTLLERMCFQPTGWQRSSLEVFEATAGPKLVNWSWWVKNLEPGLVGKNFSPLPGGVKLYRKSDEAPGSQLQFMLLYLPGRQLNMQNSSTCCLWQAVCCWIPQETSSGTRPWNLLEIHSRSMSLNSFPRIPLGWQWLPGRTPKRSREASYSLQKPAAETIELPAQLPGWVMVKLTVGKLHRMSHKPFQRWRCMKKGRHTRNREAPFSPLCPSSILY